MNAPIVESLDGDPAVQGLAPALRIRSLVKEFSGVRVLDDVDLDLRRGEVHALLGENGAGKSTLIKIIAGIYRQDGGTVAVEGKLLSPGERPRGTAFIHQELGLVRTMSVAENVALTTGYAHQSALISWKRVNRAATEVLKEVGLDIDPSLPLAELSPPEQSLVAIARALATRPGVLVLDEPTATLQESDVAMLLDALRKLREHHLAILYVTHRLDEVPRVADRVTVLRDGRRVFSTIASLTDSKQLVEAITGEFASELVDTKAPAAGKEIIRIRELSVGQTGPVTFHINEGEVFALVGLRDAGQDIVGRALFGDARITSGEAWVGDKRVRAESVKDALRAGVGMVPGSRAGEGLALGLNVRENLGLNPLSRGLGAWVGTKREKARAHGLLQRYDIRPQETERVIDTLSGGNQQKVLLARWMDATPRLLILQDPTTGVDVGAKFEIYRLIAGLLGHRVGVLLISSDFDEVARIATRALVLYRGKPVAELEGDQITAATLTAAASRAHSKASVGRGRGE